jgi:Holliday junction DNA helicase RuvA
VIAKLTGILDSVGADWAVLDCNGVGYLVTCSGRTLSRIGAPGGAVSLLVEMKVSEQAIQLFGFADTAEREWFRLLTTVQGVGAKVGLALLSALPPDRLAAAILAQDRAALTAADGVGPKLASRLANELKDKVAELGLAAALPSRSAAAAPAAAAAMPAADADGQAAADAVSALVNLGYKRIEAFTAVHAVRERLGAEAGVAELIRHGLKELAP